MIRYLAVPNKMRPTIDDIKDSEEVEDLVLKIREDGSEFPSEEPESQSDSNNIER